MLYYTKLYFSTLRWTMLPQDLKKLYCSSHYSAVFGYYFTSVGFGWLLCASLRLSKLRLDVSMLCLAPLSFTILICTRLYSVRM